MYRIRDIPRAPELDDLAGLAAQLCDVPIAAITVLDAERESVTAAVGCDLPDVQLARSLGAQGVASGEPLIVEDASRDERLASCAWVAGEPGVRFYAAVPLVTPGGLPVGTLCAMDLAPRSPLAARGPGLESLARVVMTHLEREREARLAQNLVVVVGYDGRFKRVTEAFEPILGWKPEEMEGRSLDDFLHPADVAPTRDRRFAAKSARAPVGSSFENRYRCKDGSYRWLLWSGAVVPEEECYYASAKDITKRKIAEMALRAAEEQFRRAFDDAPIGMAVLDLDRHVQRVNRALCELLGYSPEEMLNADARLFSPPADARRTERAREQLLSGAAHCVAFDKRYIRKDGEVVWAQVSASVMRDGEGNAVGLLAHVQDIRARRRSEQETRRARETAEQANRAKSEFLSRMSHELRTPLNAVLGFAQLLHFEDLPPSQRESVERIIAGGGHLLALINDVLDISRIEAGQLSIECVPLRLVELVDEAVELMRPLAAGRSVEMAVDEPDDQLIVEGDRQRVVQVLLNLLSNAVKYGPEDFEVRVATETADGRARISVVDRGPGIADEDREKLFVPFERLKAARGVEGTGLGLALSKNLMEAMHGSIGVESSTEGSAFWIELPSVGRRRGFARPERRTPRAVDLAVDGPWRTLVYIEDNPVDSELVERLVAERAEIELTVARTGREGLELIRRESPDGVLLDLDLPDMDGRDVLRALRDDPRTESLPVVVVSADAAAASEAELADSGACAFETKPVDLHRLIAALEGALATRAR